MLTTTQIDTIKATIPLLTEAGTQITEHFYKRLFTHNPELQNVFNMAHQKSGRQPAALFDAIAAYAAHIDNPEVLTDTVMRIANKHTSFNVQPAQYEVVGHHLIETLRELAPDAFTPQVEDAWVAAYAQLADIFIKVEHDLYQANANEDGGWQGFRKFRIAARQPESELVTSFVFKPVDGGSVIDYKPGQYLGIKLHPKGAEFEEIRQYSLSTVPNGETYRISVKREGADATAGIMSNYLHTHMAVGDEVELMPPAGDFYLRSGNSPVVLISAGVGLTPMQAILDTLVAQSTQQPIMYLHACASESQHSFKAHVASQKDKLNLTTYTWYEQAGYLNENEFEGRMRLAVIKDKLPLSDGEFYLCGPMPFMLFLKQQLLELGVADERVHYELFGPHQAM